MAGYYFTCASRWVSGTDESLNQFEWVVSEGPDGAVVAVGLQVPDSPHRPGPGGAVAVDGQQEGRRAAC